MKKNEITLLPDERIDQMGLSQTKIIQSKTVFSFGLDAVLLANFPRLPKRGLLVDLCAGNGAVGLFASRHTQAKIIAIEIQERLASMAERSIALNDLEDQMSVITDNLNQALHYLNASSTDLIFCNPPYFKIERGSHTNENQHYTLARHELTTNLNEIFDISRKILKSNGHFVLVHRPERFFEIIDQLRVYHLQPKRIQFVYPKAGQPANILLIDAIKDGRTGGEIFLPPLIVHKDDNTYTDEIKEIYDEHL